jgi:rhodanese-related sulfurtransferase
MKTETSKLIVGPVEYFRAKLEYEITPYGLKKVLDKAPETVCVVDVREREAYDAGHITGARSVPLDSLVTALASLPKDRVIVTCCSDLACDASEQAALELAQKGFRVQQLKGGLAEWSRRGFPVEATPRPAESQAW